MKIYTDVQNYCGKLMVGTVLVSDRDQIYMMNGNELQTDDVDQAHIYGIKRAMSFVKCNKPLYANEDVTVYTSKYYQKPYDSDTFEEKLMNDEYVNHFLQEKGVSITHNKEEFNDFDKQMLLNAEHQVRCTKHQMMMRNTINTGR